MNAKLATVACCLGAARRFRAGPITWTVRPDMPRELEPVLLDPEAFLRDPALHFKNSRVVTVTRVPMAEPGPGLVLRRLNYGKWVHRVRDAFRASRARRAFAQGLRLEAAGIDTPRPLAAADVRCLRWPLCAYLITDEVPGAQTLADICLTTGAVPREVALGIAALLARLHNAGFSHRDLKWTNVLLDAQGRPWLIDVDGVRRFRHLPESRAAADLARLAVNFLVHPEVLRMSGPKFLRAYCEHRQMRGRFRELAQSVMAALASTPHP